MRISGWGCLCGWICLVGLVGEVLTTPAAASSGPKTPPADCSIWLQSNGNAWATQWEDFAKLLTRHPARQKWGSVIYNYRLILSQQNNANPAKIQLNHRWSAPLFKAMQTQNKLQQGVQQYLRHLLQFKPQQLLGPQAVFGRTMRYQLMGQIKPVMQAIEQHREVLPFFEDSFWPQLYTYLQNLMAILKKGSPHEIKNLQVLQNKIIVTLNQHLALLPRTVFQKEIRLPHDAEDSPAIPNLWQREFGQPELNTLEKLYNQLQVMSFFVHPLYEISPGERFLLQLLAWQNHPTFAEKSEGNYYQSIKKVYQDISYSPGEIAQLLLKIQKHERQTHPSLTAQQQISIPQYQMWQAALAHDDNYPVAIHRMYKELLVTFWDAYATMHRYSGLELHPYRRLLRQVAANLDKVLAIDYQLAAPLHPRELEYIWHGGYVRQMRHQIDSLRD